MKDGLSQEGTNRQSILRCFAVLVLTFCPTVSSAVDVVRATLGKDSAWTGEGITLIVTLYSPGPFSGTASFELPDLPKTSFVRTGPPLVGSERIGDDSYFTQRHEFTIYTQRTGEIVIPSFLVRFTGKKSFAAAAEILEGFTHELRFESRLPPGTEQLGLIVAARDMKVSQTWQPNAKSSVQAGDVIARTISRRAVGTTAMMFPPVVIETLAGVRCYATDPIVQDFNERGASRAERSETIKYQFERAGTFQLPDLALIWWDPDAGELKRESLQGATINVVETATTTAVGEPPSTRRSPGILLITFLAIGLLAWLGWKLVFQFMASWQAQRNSAEGLAARRLEAACRAGEALAAYAALCEWKRVVSARHGETHLDRLLHSPPGKDLQGEWSVLSRRVFGNQASNSPWSGRNLAKAFARARHGLGHTARTRQAGSALAELNPTDSAR
jgi:hypothetical protein